MSDVNSVLFTVLLVMGSALIAVIIAVVFRVAKAVDAVQTELGALNRTVVPLLERINVLAESTQQTLASLTRHSEALGETFDNLRAVSGNVRRLEEIVQDQIEPTLRSFASLIASVRRGLQSFIDQWMGGRR
jgi:uncharacterized protein YoxC